MLLAINTREGTGMIDTRSVRELWSAPVVVLATAGAGFVLGLWSLTFLPQEMFRYISMQGGHLWPTWGVVLAPLITVMSGLIGVSLGSWVRVPGWLMSAAGSAICATAFHRPVSRFIADREILTMIIAFGCGLCAAGVALAFGAAGRRGRLAIAVGLSAGILLFHLYQFIDFRASFLRPMPWQEVVFIVVTALALAAALVAALIRGQAGKSPRRTLHLGLVAAVVLAGALWLGTMVMVDAVLDSHLDHSGIVILSGAMMVPMVWYAWRRGGIAATRLVIASAAVGPLVSSTMTFYANVFLMLVAVGLPALAGAAAAYRLDRYMPWAAIGVLLAYIGLFLDSPIFRIVNDQAWTVRQMLMVIGVGFAIGAAIGGANSRVGGEFPDAAALLFAALAAMFLSALSTSQIIYGQYPSSDADLPLALPAFGLIGSATLVVLFLLARQTAPTAVSWRMRWRTYR